MIGSSSLKKRRAVWPLEENEGKIVLTFDILNTLSFQMNKKFVNIEIVENWKMNNVNKLQTCPSRGTEVIFKEF